MNKLARNFARHVIGKSFGASPSPRTVMSRLQSVKALSCGVIGLGRMGQTHAGVLRKHPYFSLAGITSRQPEKRKIADELGCHWFESADEMIASGAIGRRNRHAALAACGVSCGRVTGWPARGLRKPLAVTAAQADLVLRVSQQSKGLLTAVFQSRFEPVYQRAKALLASGELRSIIRCEMVETCWRSDAYYRSSPWRATW
jgi:predicted dehydrogenase